VIARSATAGDDFYTRPAGKIDLCNISVPVRDPSKKP
jgi:hypothetical protein